VAPAGVERAPEIANSNGPDKKNEKLDEVMLKYEREFFSIFRSDHFL